MNEQVFNFLAANKEFEMKEQSTAKFLEEAIVRYGTEVIINRALPRIEDGLKPVQRMIIWSARDLDSDNKFVKSAKMASHTIGTYSPHGEEGTYKVMVNMVNSKCPLLEGRGNFGSTTTPPGHMRYTEARLSPLVRKICTDLTDLKVIPYEPNYDDSCQQPVYLPIAVPMILLNDTSGIAVALASKIPSFNLTEVAAACIKYLETKDIKKAVAKLVAPDQTECTIISPPEDVKTLLMNGQGALEYECIYSIAKTKRGYSLIITGCPPEFAPLNFLERCDRLCDDGVIDAARNETSENIRLVVEYSNPEVFKAVLRPMLRKRVTYHFNIVFEKDGKKYVEQANIERILSAWTAVRHKTLTASFKTELKSLEFDKSREHVKLKAVLDLQKVFQALEAVGDLKGNLQKLLDVTADEAEMIAAMSVESLKRANQGALKIKIAAIETKIASIQHKLANVDDEIISQIKEVVTWAKSKHPELLERKTIIAEV